MYRFGPKLVGFTDGDGIRYSLRALPLGGYVSFPEGGAAARDDEEASEGGAARSRRMKEEGEEEEEIIPEDDPDLLQNRPAIQVGCNQNAHQLRNHAPFPIPPYSTPPLPR